MSKHTAGPWEWVGDNLEQSENYADVIASSVSCGAWCQGGMVNLVISDADRALIAAAPDLLEALHGLLPNTFTNNPTRAEEVAHWTREHELGNGKAKYVLAAYAAIAKATGEQQ